MAIPPRFLPKAVDGLARLHRNGLRYPIPTLGIQSDPSGILARSYGGKFLDEASRGARGGVAGAGALKAPSTSVTFDPARAATFSPGRITPTRLSGSTALRRTCSSDRRASPDGAEGVDGFGERVLLSPRGRRLKRPPRTSPRGFEAPEGAHDLAPRGGQCFRGSGDPGTRRRSEPARSWRYARPDSSTASPSTFGCCAISAQRPAGPLRRKRPPGRRGRRSGPADQLTQALETVGRRQAARGRAPAARPRRPTAKRRVAAISSSVKSAPRSCSSVSSSLAAPLAGAGGIVVEAHGCEQGGEVRPPLRS